MVPRWLPALEIDFCFSGKKPIYLKVPIQGKEKRRLWRAGSSPLKPIKIKERVDRMQDFPKAIALAIAKNLEVA